MKTLPAQDFLWKMAQVYDAHGGFIGDKGWPVWLATHGFKVPVEHNVLEFDESFTDEDMLVFVIKWS
jgi:hypothetical protein